MALGEGRFEAVGVNCTVLRGSCGEPGFIEKRSLCGDPVLCEERPGDDRGLHRRSLGVRRGTRLRAPRSRPARVFAKLLVEALVRRLPGALAGRRERLGRVGWVKMFPRRHWIDRFCPVPPTL